MQLQELLEIRRRWSSNSTSLSPTMSNRKECGCESINLICLILLAPTMPPRENLCLRLVGIIYRFLRLWRACSLRRSGTISKDIAAFHPTFLSIFSSVGVRSMKANIPRSATLFLSNTFSPTVAKARERRASSLQCSQIMGLIIVATPMWS